MSFDRRQPIAQGIGRRLDGWPNRDLNVGAIVARPDLSVVADLLQTDQPTVRKVLNSWAPASSMRNSSSTAKRSGLTEKRRHAHPGGIRACGRQPDHLHGLGGISHWNAFVANSRCRQRHVRRCPIGRSAAFPVAARAGFGNVRNDPDLIVEAARAAVLPAGDSAPMPAHILWSRAAARGGRLQRQGELLSCHVPPLFTEPGWNMHTPQEIGIDDFQSADRRTSDTGPRHSAACSWARAASTTTAASLICEPWSIYNRVFAQP